MYSNPNKKHWGGGYFLESSSEFQIILILWGFRVCKKTLKLGNISLFFVAGERMNAVYSRNFQGKALHILKKEKRSFPSKFLK